MGARRKRLTLECVESHKRRKTHRIQLKSSCSSVGIDGEGWYRCTRTVECVERDHKLKDCIWTSWRCRSNDCGEKPIHKMAGDGNNDQRNDDDSEDRTMSGGTVDSTRVEGTRLTGEGQHVRQHQKSKIKNLPVSSGAAYQVVGRRRREGQKSHLRTSVKRWRSKLLTLDVATRCGHCLRNWIGMLNKFAVGKRNLMQGSASVTVNMDEALLGLRSTEILKVEAVGYRLCLCTFDDYYAVRSQYCHW